MSVTIDNATGKIIDLAVAVQAYDSASAIRTENGTAIIAGFKGLDFAAFSAQQSAIIAQLVSAKLSDNAESAKRMLQRTIDNLGIEKPKAPGASAEKQAKRETEKLETAKLVDSARNFGVAPCALIVMLGYCNLQKQRLQPASSKTVHVAAHLQIAVGNCLCASP
jgi:hypothetical protein